MFLAPALMQRSRAPAFLCTKVCIVSSVLFLMISLVRTEVRSLCNFNIDIASLNIHDVRPSANIILPFSSLVGNSIGCRARHHVNMGGVFVL